MELQVIRQEIVAAIVVTRTDIYTGENVVVFLYGELFANRVIHLRCSFA